MAATSDDEMENLLTLADQISDDFRSGIEEIQTLRSKLDAEVKNRQSLELTCASLRRESDRLKNLRLEFLNNLTIQLQQRGDSHGLRDELKRLADEWIRKEEEYRREIESIKRNSDEKIRVLEGQIRAISRQKATDEGQIKELKKLNGEWIRKEEDYRREIDSTKRNSDEKIRVLEGQIREISSQKASDECQIREELEKLTDEWIRKEEDYRREIESIKRNCDEKIRVLESQTREISSQKAADEAAIYQLHHELISCRNQLKDEEVKYQGEIEDLRFCIFAEQQEKEELSKKVRDLEKELLVTRTRMKEQQGSSSDKQLDAMKQKMMKLRKENEVLKRQLLASDVHAKKT